VLDFGSGGLVWTFAGVGFRLQPHFRYCPWFCAGAASPSE
jgi:hypothetical protein